MFKEVSVYFFIALIGYGIDVTVYLLLLEANVDVYSAYLFALVVGLSLNVVLLRRFFKKGRFGFLKDIWLTIIANGVILLFGFGLYASLLAAFKVDPLVAKLISNSITFSINFILRKTHF